MPNIEICVLGLKATSKLHLTTPGFGTNQGLINDLVVLDVIMVNLSFFYLYALIKAIVPTMFNFSP